MLIKILLRLISFIDIYIIDKKLQLKISAALHLPDYISLCNIVLIIFT